MQYSFGTGVLFGRRTDVSNPTPVQFGGLQGVTLDMSFTTKELFSQYQFPIAIGRGTGKITGKADFAQLNAQAFNDIFFGETSGPTAGEYVTSVQEAQTVGAVAGNTIYPTYNTTYIQDLGVIVNSTGAVLTRVAATPGATEYSCNETTGTYTFNSTNNAVAMRVSYMHTDTGNGKTVSITNKLLGSAPVFLAVLTSTFQTKKLTLQLNKCMSSKISLATKLEDFTIPSFDFASWSDDSNMIGKLWLDE